jgi:hypothetical protein
MIVLSLHTVRDPEIGVQLGGSLSEADEEQGKVCELEAMK